MTTTMKPCRHFSVRATSLIRCFCTAMEAEAEVPPAAVTQQRSDKRLYSRLSALRATGPTVAQTLNQYFREGKVIKKVELERCIRELRKYRNYKHALEIMEWMEKRDINFSHADNAVRLDLISKAQGLPAAENFFNGLSQSGKNRFTYGALLNCYCKEKLTNKAEALFKKMDELGIASTYLAYNNLMALYMRLLQPEKVPPLVQEMKNKNIPLSTFTYNIWMTSHSYLNDIEGAEKVFEEIKRDNRRYCEWTTYSNLAVVYVNAGLYEKAESLLQKVEAEIGNLRISDRRQAFHFLLSLYAKTSNLGEVHRIWESLKSAFEFTSNISYLVMLQALARLNDVEGLRKCFEEWKSTCSSYDIRLANTAIGSYLKHNMIKEAEKVLHEAIQRSAGPFSWTWGAFMSFYLQNHQIDLALKCMEAATTEVKDKWYPSLDSINKFLEYFEKERDVEGAEKLCQSLKKVNCLDSNAYKLLLQTYIAASKTAPGMRQRIENDGIEISSELENLLGTVCVE